MHNANTLHTSPQAQQRQAEKGTIYAVKVLPSTIEPLPG